ncbi:MAG: PIN domain-containing protein [Armatimonadota bacterium]|nr:PIN domain-containing protein [Armatimonadota bacterium]MDW8144463.1 PIN domain-containing protein [Armatimonadota bacterium]
MGTQTMRLEEALEGVVKLALDTPPVIYFVEAHPEYDALVTAIFQKISDGQIVGLTSVITVTEVLVLPLRQGKVALAAAYWELLTNSANMQLVSIDPEIARKAAELRSRYNLRTPDALQLAAAIKSGCDAFLTNDATLKKVTELKVLVLSELQPT